jgi:hypothetical protein
LICDPKDPLIVSEAIGLPDGPCVGAGAGAGVVGLGAGGMIGGGAGMETLGAGAAGVVAVAGVASGLLL